MTAILPAFWEASWSVTRVAGSAFANQASILLAATCVEMNSISCRTPIFLDVAVSLLHSEVFIIKNVKMKGLEAKRYKWFLQCFEEITLAMGGYIALLY